MSERNLDHESEERFEPSVLIERQSLVEEFSSNYWKGLILAILLGYPIVSMFVMPGNTYWVSLSIELFVFGIAVLAYDLLFGFTGLLSFGHALFFGGGAYTVAILTTNYGVNYYLTIPVAVGVGFVLALIVGAISLRLSGVYFAMITLAFGQLVYEIVLEFNKITGGVNGISDVPIPTVMGIDPSNNYIGYYLAFFILAAVFLGLRRVVNSPFGRVIQGIRENEERMEMLGINPYRYKLASFVLAGSVTALGGVLYPLFLNFVNPGLLFWVTTGDFLLMTIIGGMGTLWGPLAGVGFKVLLQEGLSGFVEQWRIVYGTIFILFVLFVPSGIAGLASGEGKTLFTHIREWRESDDTSISALISRIVRRGGER